MQPRSLLVGVFLAGVIPAVPLVGQGPFRSPATADLAPSVLDSLVERAIAASPTIRAAAVRVDAARARVGPASALPDPMLMFGVLNQPLGGASASPASTGATGMAAGPEAMTMRMVGVRQMLPHPGKRALQKRSAEREVDAWQASLDAARRQVARDVKATWYELAFIDRALTIVERSHDVLAGLIRISESRYSVGTAGQQDVLKARVEATRLAETAAGLTERQLALGARLDALLDQPAHAPLPRVAMPEAIVRAAGATSSDAIRFTSAAFGSRAADSPLPPLDELQEMATRLSPELREQDAMIGAESAQVELARKAILPDVELALQYGQRGGGRRDMVSATVSLPIPIFRGRKQDQQVAEAGARLAALEAERRVKSNDIRAEVARLVSEIERERTSLALSVKAILPQSRAALTSSTASYQVGKVEFLTVLENQSIVFRYETEYFRALSDFATKAAELERLVGREVLP